MFETSEIIQEMLRWCYYGQIGEECKAGHRSNLASLRFRVNAATERRKHTQVDFLWITQRFRTIAVFPINWERLDAGVFTSMLSRPQVDLTFERFRFLAPCQRLRVIVCVLSAFLRSDESSTTCVCLRLREQWLRSEITSVARVAHVLLLRFVAGNVGVNTPASKRSQLIGNTAIVRKRSVIHKKIDLCVLSSFSCRVYAETQGRKVRPVAGFMFYSCVLSPVTWT